MDKDKIDEAAEREASALRKAGRRSNCNESRIRQAKNYGKENFEKLFKN